MLPIWILKHPMASESWLAALKHMYMRPYNNVEQFSLLTCKGNCVKHQLALLLLLGWRVRRGYRGS